ncbi:MAG: DUF998 domain-containing protein [Candidatus Lokiarchaeota archaeon]|nr:DUF998 domain-containing protein [Candidatus Lokiarchaeota archaeon]
MSIINRVKESDLPNKIGFIAPIISLSCIGLAILLSPGFTWIGNALSDLGHYTRTDLGPYQLYAAVIFNVGLTLTGLLMLYFTLYLLRRITEPAMKIALSIFVISCIFLTAIGIFSENFSPTHYIVSVGFFLTFPFAMWALGLGWLRFPKKRLFAVISLLLPFVSLYMWSQPWDGVAIPEIVTALSAIIWIWIIDWLHVSGSLSEFDKKS